MADGQPNNQRYYDLYADHADLPLSDLVKTAIDAVIAAVQAKEARDRRTLIRYAKGIQRADIARAIRADTSLADAAVREHYARIAEGNADR